MRFKFVLGEKITFPEAKFLRKNNESENILPRLTKVNSRFLLPDFFKGVNGRKFNFLSRFTEVN